MVRVFMWSFRRVLCYMRLRHVNTETEKCEQRVLLRFLCLSIMISFRICSEAFQGLQHKNGNNQPIYLTVPCCILTQPCLTSHNKTFGNSADPNQTPHNAASVQALHYFHKANGYFFLNKVQLKQTPQNE